MSTFSTTPPRLRAALPGIRTLLPALAAVSLLTVMPPVWAQMLPSQGQQQGAYIDPPGRVARMNLAEGAVSFAPADDRGDARWTAAVLNRPLTRGDRLWTGQRARSELHIGSTAVRMGEQTSLDFLALDDDTTQLRLAQGTVRLRVRNLFQGQQIEVNTPNLAFVISQPGDYRIDAIPASNVSAGSTRVVVQAGAGTIYGDGGASVNLAGGQQANFTDTQLTPAGLAPEVQDSFDAWALQRDRLEDQSVSARYVPREVTGYQQLDNYGDWRQDPAYGAVWLPRAVPANWAPYSAGHWSWIAPWGWTWVDDAPWGFAPFHYGRWAQIGPQWGWVPGRLAPRPVYAPALVAFIGGNAGGANWNVSLGQQAARPGLGWFPLAPGEAFRPAYRVSPRYVTNVNHNIVVNNYNSPNNYRYQRQPNAVTAMSATDFSRGQPVRGDRQRLTPADLGRAQVLSAERGGLPQRFALLRELQRESSAAALPPAAVAVRPVVASQTARDAREGRQDRRDDRGDDRRSERRDAAPGNLQDRPRFGRPGERADDLRQPAVPMLPALPQAGAGRPVPLAAPDRGAAEAEQRARFDQQRQQQAQQQDQQRQQRAQQDQARQQPGPGGPRQLGEESLGQRALREQAQQNGNTNLAVPPMPQARPDVERNSIEQIQRDMQRLQRQQADVARQQEQQRRQNEDALGQRALREQNQQQAQQQAQRQQAQDQQAQQAQQANQRAQQDQQRQAREQQQQQRQQPDPQRQEQAQQRAQQEQARQQQLAQQQLVQQQQMQQRAQNEQQRQAREQQQQQQQQQRQQPDQPRDAGRDRPQPPSADALLGRLPRLEDRRKRE